MNAKTLNEDKFSGLDLKDQRFHAANYLTATFSPSYPYFGDRFTAADMFYRILSDGHKGTFRQTVGRILTPYAHVVVNIPSHMSPGSYPVTRWDYEDTPTTCAVGFVANGEIRFAESGKITFKMNDKEKLLSAAFEVNLDSSVVRGTFEITVE